MGAEVEETEKSRATVYEVAMLLSIYITVLSQLAKQISFLSFSSHLSLSLFELVGEQTT